MAAAGGLRLAAARGQRRRRRNASRVQLRHRHDRSSSRPSDAERRIALLTAAGRNASAHRRSRVRAPTERRGDGRVPSRRWLHPATAPRCADSRRASRRTDLRPRIEPRGAARRRARGAPRRTVAAVISNRADARWPRDRAASHGVAASGRRSRALRDRDAFDAALAAAIDASEPDLVVLAGFMRVLGRAFVRALRGPHAQHPSVAAARLSRPRHPPPRAGRRRAHPRLHRAFRHAGLDHGPIDRARRGAGASRRRRGDAGGARARGGAPHPAAAVRAFCEGRLRHRGSTGARYRCRRRIGALQVPPRAIPERAGADVRTRRAQSTIGQT